MFNLGKTKSLIGLDIGSSSVKAVELKKTKAGYELVSYGIETLAQDTVVDGAIMDAPSVAEKIISIFDGQKIKTKDVATSVSGHSVIVKRVSMPLMTEDELYDRVQAEASQHIPFDIADVNLSHQLLEATEWPNVTIQIIPFLAGGHAAAGGPFSILRFAEFDLPDVVYLEQLTSALYLDKRDTVEHYLAVMERLCLEASPAAASAKVISEIMAGR